MARVSISLECVVSSVARARIATQQYGHVAAGATKASVTYCFFLALSYFGTDQSQVGRYLGGRSAAESRLGLLFNGLLKVPMQAFILLVGVMVFVFYQFAVPPVFFNPVPLERIRRGPHAAELAAVEARHLAAFEARKSRRTVVRRGTEERERGRPRGGGPRARVGGRTRRRCPEETLELIRKRDPTADANDTNYVFLSFVLAYLPVGLVGLVVAVVFAAAMSSIAAALQSLAGTTVVDVYGRLLRKSRPDAHYLRVGRLATVFWGLVAMSVAMYANRLGTLIEAVNILGSLVYGTILGIFLVAFYLPKVRGTPVFVARARQRGDRPRLLERDGARVPLVQRRRVPHRRRALPRDRGGRPAAGRRLTRRRVTFAGFPRLGVSR